MLSEGAGRNEELPAWNIYIFCQVRLPLRYPWGQVWDPLLIGHLSTKFLWHLHSCIAGDEYLS